MHQLRYENIVKLRDSRSREDLFDTIIIETFTIIDSSIEVVFERRRHLAVIPRRWSFDVCGARVDALCTSAVLVRVESQLGVKIVTCLTRASSCLSSSFSLSPSLFLSFFPLCPLSLIFSLARVAPSKMPVYLWNIVTRPSTTTTTTATFSLRCPLRQNQEERLARNNNAHTKRAETATIAQVSEWAHTQVDLLRGELPSTLTAGRPSLDPPRVPTRFLRGRRSAGR